MGFFKISMVEIKCEEQNIKHLELFYISHQNNWGQNMKIYFQ